MPRLAPLLALLVLLFPISLSAQFPIAAVEKRPATGNQWSPAVASSGGDFLAAWPDGRAHHFFGSDRDTLTQIDIYATRIGLDGIGVSEGGVPINPTSSQEWSPAVVWNGSEYVVIHHVRGDGGGVLFTTILPDRLTEGRRIPVRQEYVGQLEVAWNGSRYLVVRETPDAPDASMKAFLVSADFQLAVSEFHPAARPAHGPSVASDGEDFLLAWVAETSVGDIEIRVAVISNDGSVRGGETLATFPHNMTLSVSPPSIAWNGTNYLVVWSDGASIRAREVDRNGNAAAEAFTIARSSGIEVAQPDVAWNGSMYLVSFSYRNEWPTPMSIPTTNLYAARVAGDGTLVDAPYPLTISTTPGANDQSRVAASGSTFIVVWNEGSDVLSVTVDAATGKVGPQNVVARSISYQGNARGVFDGSNLGFAWGEAGEDGSIMLFGRVAPDGTPLDGGGVQVSSGLPGPMAVADVYLLTWRNGADPFRAIRISREGEILDEKPLELPIWSGVLSTDGQTFLHVGTQTVDSEFGQYRVNALHAEIIGSSGAPSTPREIVPPARFDQIPLGLAWNGSSYLLLYHQLLGALDCRCVGLPSRELRMVMLDRSGERISDSMLLQRHASGFVVGGRDRFFIAIGRTHETEPRYTVIDNDVTELGSGPIGFELVDAAWDGALFNIVGFRESAHLLRVDRNGTRISETTLPGVQQPLSLRLIPAGGAVALLERRVEKTTSAHDAGIPRYQFSWLDQRRRAVAR